MRPDTFKSEAEECRRQAAAAFSGRPEAAFLLSLAQMFDELGSERPSAATPTGTVAGAARRECESRPAGRF